MNFRANSDWCSAVDDFPIDSFNQLMRTSGTGSDRENGDWPMDLVERDQAWASPAQEDDSDLPPNRWRRWVLALGFSVLATLIPMLYDRIFIWLGACMVLFLLALARSLDSQGWDRLHAVKGVVIFGGLMGLVGFHLIHLTWATWPIRLVGGHVGPNGGDNRILLIAGVWSVSSVNLRHTEITDSDMADLRVAFGRLPNLTFLDLSNNRITDQGIEHLRGLSELSELYLDETQVTDKGLDVLCSLKSQECNRSTNSALG
jgi:hypothetical protein